VGNHAAPIGIAKHKPRLWGGQHGQRQRHCWRLRSSRRPDGPSAVWQLPV